MKRLMRLFIYRFALFQVNIVNMLKTHTSMCRFVVIEAAGAFYIYEQAYLFGIGQPLTEPMEAPPLPAQELEEPRRAPQAIFLGSCDEGGGSPNDRGHFYTEMRLS